MYESDLLPHISALFKFSCFVCRFALVTEVKQLLLGSVNDAWIRLRDFVIYVGYRFYTCIWACFRNDPMVYCFQIEQLLQSETYNRTKQDPSIQIGTRNRVYIAISKSKKHVLQLFQGLFSVFTG